MLASGLSITSTPVMRVKGAGSPSFDPASLFTGGAFGLLADSQSPMWADTARTTPASVDAAIAAWDDRSGNGNHIIINAAAGRPIQRQGSGLRWLEFDGVDDRLESALVVPAGTYLCAFANNQIGNNATLLHDNTDGGTGIIITDTSTSTVIAGANSQATIDNLFVDGADTGFVQGITTRNQVRLAVLGAHSVRAQVTLAAQTLNPMFVLYNLSPTYRFLGNHYAFLLIDQAAAVGHEAEIDAWLAREQGL